MLRSRLAIGDGFHQTPPRRQIAPIVGTIAGKGFAQERNAGWVQSGQALFELQQVRAMALAAKDPGQRAAIDKKLRDQVIPQFNRFATQEAGLVRNNWLGTMVIGNYGEDFWIRSSANLIGIWANNTHEVIYFVTTRDALGRPLDGSNTYELHFPKDALPQHVVNAFWSVHLVGVPDFMPVPNRLDRFVLSTYSNVETNPDGSLTLVLAPNPVAGIPEANWLPTAPGKPFSLTWRTYIPKEIVKQGNWSRPPAMAARWCTPARNRAPCTAP